MEIETYIKIFMPECYKNDKYRFSANKYCDLDLYIEHNCHKLKVCVNIRCGDIEIYDLNTSNNFKGKLDRMHLQKKWENDTSWIFIIEWISNLHCPSDMNKNYENKVEYKNSQGKSAGIRNIFDLLKDDKYKEIIK